ncbi:MAG: bifunctional glycosyltransferase/class I SAM-dependent methyltransferase, partial [Clostridia bacterium]
TRLIGYCYLIKKEVIDQVGLLDERFTPGNFEDDDFSFRTISKGYKLLLCKDTFIHHFQSVSFSAEQEKFIQVYSINRQKFYKKWGFNAEYSAGIRFDLINTINEDVDKEMNILEVGCGIGSSLLEIKNRYKNANIYGLEISEGAGNIVKHLCSTIIGNIEELELGYEDGFFDYIIFGDVLEHLRDPWKIVKEMKKYLKESGSILASIPNIMHISVIKDILNGRFPYAESGILDKTHLRFFTLAEIQNLFMLNDYEISEIRANGVYLSKEDEDSITKLCKLSSENLKQQYMAYQYIVKAKHKKDVSKYESDDMIKFRFKLMRIDNNIDVEESLNYIFDMYEKYQNEFLEDLTYLINNNVINKEAVLNKIKDEALNRKYTNFI